MVEWTKPSFIIKAVAFYGNSIGDTQYKDSRDLDGTIPEQFDQAMRFLDNNLHHIQAGQSFNSLGILEVSRIALEEILQNAQVHREYIKTAPIRLLIFANRIEIISPGCLPGNMTVEGIQLGESFQRNPLLASFCAKTMVYRGLGSGIVRARKDGAKIEFRNDEETNQFIAIIWRNELAEKGVSLDENSASLAEKGVSLAEKGVSLSEKGVSLNEKGLSKREQVIAKILAYCQEPKSVAEIADHIGMTNRYKVKINYIDSLLGSKMAMTKPDVPTSPKQKYYTIHKD